METAKKIDRVIFHVLKGVSYASAVSVFLVALICAADALLSKIFSVNIPNATDWVTFLNIPVVFLSFAFIQVERGHTVVDIFLDKFPKVMQTVIRVIGQLMGIFVCSLGGYYAIRLTIDKIAKGTKASSATNSFLVWPFAMIVALGFFLIAIAFLWTLIRDFIIPKEERMGALPMGEPEGILAMGMEDREEDK